MSLLSDLLSKVKYPNPGKEVPPGLKSTVSALKKKESNKRLLAVVTILAVVLMGAGFATVYLIEIYIKGGARQSGLQKNIAIEQRKQQTQSQPTLDIKPYQEPLTERQKKPSEIAKARQPEKKSEKKDIQDKKRGTVEPKKKSPQKKSVLEVVQDPKFKNLDEAEKKMGTEKTAEDTSEKDLYLHLAKGYEAKRDYSKALDSYKKILRIEPKNYRVMNNIASILIQQGSNEEAKVYLRMAIEIKK
ncbi:MAG: tetratricopeptide repeat protein, partial [Thermodesulfovibrionales bacterium]